ncbi:hypothetical protein [Flavobacterium sp.]|uniref:hypothetical protein n=1 Tax=Flavobacterium sp. TaxID=239 RepID=UPI002B4AFEB6|nr:hypothetical protein [Flavobacterium sp.]HLF52664.1 hypothetical protein [Flavobacterium sp.]
MRKITFTNRFLITFSFLFIFSFLISSCQKEELTENKELAPNSDFSLIINGNCESDCIVEDGPYFENIDQTIVSWGGPNNNNFSKTVDIKYFNTETHFILQVKSTKGWSDLVINGVSSWTGGNVAPNVWETYSYPLDEGWQACDLESFTLQVTGNGPQANFNVSYSLIGLCGGCETSFIGEPISCDETREAVYTFTSEEDLGYIKIQGGLTNFTGQDAIITVLGGNLTASQSTPGGSSNRIIKVEGSATACEPVTIHVTWNSSNSGGIITGNWSVKNSNGDEVAPSVAGLECN